MKCKTSIFIQKPEIQRIKKHKSDRIREVIHIRHHRQEMQIFYAFPSVIDSFHIKKPRATPTAGESSRVSTIRQLQRKRQKTKPTGKGKKRKTKPSLSLNTLLFSLSSLVLHSALYVCAEKAPSALYRLRVLFTDI